MQQSRLIRGIPFRQFNKSWFEKISIKLKKIGNSVYLLHFNVVVVVVVVVIIIIKKAR
jgi:hypothetical protein